MKIDADDNTAGSAAAGPATAPRQPDLQAPASAGPDGAVTADQTPQAGVTAAEDNPTPDRPSQRLGWLDALRGIAVLAVVYEHASTYLFPEVKAITVQWAHAGTFGVMLFFLVSGYVVPASIERRGRVRDFWIGRVFRLYPAYLFTIAAALLLAALGVGGFPKDFVASPGTSLLGHVTMLPYVLGVDAIQGQFWTLAYEMCFYLVVTVVFVAGVHRFSAEIAILLAGATAVFGGSLPSRAFAPNDQAVRNLVVLTAMILLAGVLAVSNRRRSVVIAGAVLLGAFVVTLMGANQGHAAWEGFIILGVMFSGTAIYRTMQGQIRWQRAAVALIAVFASAAVNVYSIRHLVMVHGKSFPVERSWLGGLLLAILLFGVGLALRHWRVPSWLTWIGGISYSVYLLHYLLLELLKDEVRGMQDGWVLARFGISVAYVAVLLGVCALTHRFVELPGQRLGRRMIRRLQNR